MRQLSIMWLILPLIFGYQSVAAQLSLHIDEHFFAGKKILKAETTWDSYVWVLGENNFIARISPDDQVEDFTAFFAGYSTKPFTDISSRSANTLLSGTDGDYAFLFAKGNIRQIGPDHVDAPKFTFDYPDTVDLCKGDTFPMEVENAQGDYSYQWYRNGEALAGETRPAFSATEAGTYAVEVSASGDNVVFSDSVTIRLHYLEKPVSSDEAILMCEGVPRRIRVTGYAPETIKRWYRDGVLLPGESDAALVVTQPGAYSVEIAIGSCSVTSDQLTVRFVALPVAKIKAANEGPLCYGTSTTLTADHAAGETYTYRWSTGENTRSIEVSDPGIYTLVLTNAVGCSDTTEFDLDGYDPVQAPRIRDTVLCSAANEMIRVEAPAGYLAYRWNRGAGSGRYFDISVPGTYALEVQDEKGCTVTTTFEVTSACQDITIPNTFSPNGDGINDVWMIGGVEDGAALVRVFDRNGQQVFQSQDYRIPWDGLYQGRLVPVGAYYYYITTLEGKDFKGALNVLY